MAPRESQRGREDVEPKLLSGPAGHAHVLLPIELQLAARRRLEPRMGLRSVGAREDDVAGAAVVREGVVAGKGRVSRPVQQVLVHGLLRDARQRRLCGDDVPVAVEAAGAPAPAVVHVASFPPIAGDRVPVQVIAPGYLAEVGLDAQLAIHVQLAHDVPLFQSGLLPLQLATGEA